MAVQENTDLFICVTGKKMTNTYTFYIEKDNNEKTGNVIEWWSKATGDYKIADDKLYRFSNGKWESVNIQSGFELVKNDTTIEIRLDIKLLGLAESQEIKIGFYDEKNGLIPSAGKEMMVVDKAAPAILEPNIKIDGEYSSQEWNNLKIADGQDKIKELYAYKDTQKLYIMVLGESLDGVNNSIYLNTDNNTSTGYKNWGQYGDNGAGADYLLSSDETGWKLYKSINGYKCY